MLLGLYCIRVPSLLVRVLLSACARSGRTAKQSDELRGSFDHLVGAGEQCRRHVQANRLRHDQVNDEVELSRRLDRKIGGLRPNKILSTKSPARR